MGLLELNCDWLKIPTSRFLARSRRRYFRRRQATAGNTSAFADKYTSSLPSVKFLIEGGIGIFGFCGFGYFFDPFLGQKTPVFRFGGSSRFTDVSFFSIWFSIFVIKTSGFSVFVSDVVVSFSYFVLYGLRFLFDLSNNHSRPQSSWSFSSASGIESSGRTRFSEHAQSIRFVFSADQICQSWREVLELLASGVGKSQSSPSGFRFCANFLAVLRFWTILSSVLRFLIHPKAPLPTSY